MNLRDYLTHLIQDEIYLLLLMLLLLANREEFKQKQQMNGPDIRAKTAASVKFYKENPKRRFTMETHEHIRLKQFT